MGQVTKEEIKAETQRRRERIHGYMVADPPLPLPTICEIEGMHPRAGRALVKEIEAEFGLKYMGVHSRPPRDQVPFGLTAATQRLRQKLADNLYLLRERGKDSNHYIPAEVAARIGLNSRAQLKAKERPFAYDWKISEMERLARELGRDPQEFILSCLTT